ncbi:MAG: DUF167 domain-containing protein [Chloroflexota bacterium]
MIQEHPQGTSIDVYVQPRASRTEVAGEHAGRLKVRVAAPPVDGAANTELIAFFSKAIGLPKRDVSILRGESGRQKTLLVRNVQPSEVRNRIGHLD